MMENETQNRWIPVEESKPAAGKKVYVICESKDYGSGRKHYFQTIAYYIPYMTVKEEDFMCDEFFGDGDYNEEEDKYYTPEGWYEWQSVPDMNWRIYDHVAHWMPLFPIPIADKILNKTKI